MDMLEIMLKIIWTAWRLWFGVRNKKQVLEFCAAINMRINHTRVSSVKNAGRLFND